MNKTLLVLTALISFGYTNSQIKDKGTIEITPKIGTSNFFENNEYDSSGYNSGVEFGATIDYYFNNRWSLRSGLITSKMGGRVQDAGNIYEDKLNYLSIPINANWHFGSTRKWNLNFGLSPSFLLNSKVNNFYISNGDIEPFQLGFTYGIGYKIEIDKKFGILIDTQFFNGLTNINKTTDLRILNAGYSFNLGGVIQL